MSQRKVPDPVSWPSEQAGGCSLLALISEDFHDDIREMCERCNGLGQQCLAEAILDRGRNGLH